MSCLRESKNAEMERTKLSPGDCIWHTESLRTGDSYTRAEVSKFPQSAIFLSCRFVSGTFSGMLLKTLVLWAAASLCLAQAPQNPDVSAQRAAMQKLGFLVGTWSGHTRIWRGADNSVELSQTENVTYKLGGLILMIEGIGINNIEHKTNLQALGLISFDDAAGVYRMRAFNDGRWLDSTVELNESRKQLHWGFTLAQTKTSSTLQVDANGNWTETHEISLNSQPFRKFMEVSVAPSK